MKLVSFAAFSGVLFGFASLSYADIASTTYVDNVANTKQATISDLGTIRTGAGLGATAVQPSSLSTVATSGSYNDLANKPTIPTVNNATLTINRNGTSVGTFTANASSDKTIDIDVSQVRSGSSTSNTLVNIWIE
ncbi:MAG: hypothetical protein KBS86_03720 [Proteobacteria bacterium]|nr:hypothetical protein [Candidatus Enterousia scatequi]